MHFSFEKKQTHAPNNTKMQCVRYLPLSVQSQRRYFAGYDGRKLRFPSITSICEKAIKKARKKEVNSKHVTLCVLFSVSVVTLQTV
jgi:hypothetical protein